MFKLYDLWMKHSSSLCLVVFVGLSTLSINSIIELQKPLSELQRNYLKLELSHTSAGALMFLCAAISFRKIDYDEKNYKDKDKDEE